MTPAAERDLMEAILAPLTKPLHVVYPLYLASRAKKGLTAAMDDPDGIIESVGGIQSLGNSRYAIPVTDSFGTRYRITVEVVS